MEPTNRANGTPLSEVANREQETEGAVGSAPAPESAEAPPPLTALDGRDWQWKPLEGALRIGNTTASPPEWIAAIEHLRASSPAASSYAPTPPPAPREPRTERDPWMSCECGHPLALHRIGDDACPVINGDDLSFAPPRRFRAHEPRNEEGETRAEFEAATSALPDDGEGRKRTLEPRLANTDAEVVEHAERIIAAMCQGDRWRMSIPVHRHDSDIVLTRLADRFRARLTERDALVAAAREFVPGARHSIGCSLVPCNCGLHEIAAAVRALPPSPADRTEDPTDV